MSRLIFCYCIQETVRGTKPIEAREEFWLLHTSVWIDAFCRTIAGFSRFWPYRLIIHQSLPLAMDVAFSLPEDLARKLQERWGDLSRRALESLVAQAYREESLTLGEVRRLLGHETRMETEAFLKEQGALLDYSEEELEQDLEAALKASNR